MTEPTQPAAAAPAAPAQEPTQTPPAGDGTPPWGSPDQFNPEKAWNLIEGLRADKEKLAARPTVTPEQAKQLEEYQRLVEASKSEQQRQAEMVAAAQREAELARTEAVRFKVAATHGIGAEHFDLLGTGSEEEVSARAGKLAALLAAQAAAAATPPAASTPPTRPMEQLRPGATPGEPANEEDVLMSRLFGQ